MAQNKQHQFTFEDSPSSDRLSNRVLQWLARSYGTLLEWRARASDTYLAANGDSAMARNRVAFEVRSYFLQGDLVQEHLAQWRPGFESLETVQVTPPKVSPSNAAYVDWVRVADYLLLGVASPTDPLEQANQQRETEFQTAIGSWRIRQVVYSGAAAIRADNDLPDEVLLARLKEDHPDASMANIKEARRVARDGQPLEAPRQPVPAARLEVYQPLYF
ncbi:MAG: hypothetical protein CMJ75_14910 [Planctomycetaceae bacterium]|nr:hypothetical protein [Planctomycetaceae bacterium]